MPHLIAISGSMRAASTNSALLRAMARHAPDDCTMAVYDGLGHLPIFNPDNEGARTPAEAAALIEKVSRADGIIVSCPEYAHGVPGGLKNALDWLVSRDAAVAKPAMLVHASSRSVHARAALTEIMRTMSFALYDGPELEIALIGKKSPEVDKILSDPGNAAAMATVLSRFLADMPPR